MFESLIILSCRDFHLSVLDKKNEEEVKNRNKIMNETTVEKERQDEESERNEQKCCFFNEK